MGSKVIREISVIKSLVKVILDDPEVRRGDLNLNTKETQGLVY